MDMTEEAIYEALGIEKEQQQPAEAQEQGEESTTDLLSETGSEPETGTEDPSGSETAGADSTGEQDKDTRHANAARRREEEQKRRQQEQQTAIDQAVERALAAEREKNRKELDGIFERAGLSNSYDKTPIKNRDDFEKWYKSHEDAKLQKALKDGKLTQDALNAAIERNPTIAAINAQNAQEQQAARAAKEAADRAQIEKELEEIRRYDPSIKSVADLRTMPNHEAFEERVSRGMSFIEAYRLANWDSLQQKQQEAARQQAQSNARSKDHLGSLPASRGKGAVSVPRDVAAMYRVFNPQATDEEIARHYNSTQK